jgi:hypothetical protein
LITSFTQSDSAARNEWPAFAARVIFANVVQPQWEMSFLNMTLGAMLRFYACEGGFENKIAQMRTFLLLVRTDYGTAGTRQRNARIKNMVSIKYMKTLASRVFSHLL